MIARRRLSEGAAPREAGTLAVMQLASKIVVHQVHPAKIGADVMASVVSNTLLWRGRPKAALAVRIVLPAVGSLAVLTLANLAALAQTAPGRNISPTVEPGSSVCSEPTRPRAVGAPGLGTGLWRRRRSRQLRSADPGRWQRRSPVPPGHAPGSGNMRPCPARGGGNHQPRSTSSCGIFATLRHGRGRKLHGCGAPGPSRPAGPELADPAARSGTARVTPIWQSGDSSRP